MDTRRCHIEGTHMIVLLYNVVALLVVIFLDVITSLYPAFKSVLPQWDSTSSHQQSPVGTMHLTKIYSLYIGISHHNQQVLVIWILI